MKVLIIGDPNSLFILNYVKNLREFSVFDIEIDLLGTFRPFRMGEAKTYFNKTFLLPSSKHVYKHKTIQLFLRLLIIAWVLLTRRKKYSVIHCFYAYKDFALLKYLFQNLPGRLVLTIYGSDFYNITSYWKRHLRGFFEQAVKITFANPKTKFDFQRQFNIDENKLVISRFGLEPLKNLTKAQKIPQTNCREALGIPLNKTVIAVGYNFDLIQQHNAIIDSILGIKDLESRKDDIFFLFPMTNGQDLDNKIAVLNNLKVFKYSHKVFEQFMTNEEIAYLRKATDIMIQVQKTDQLSGSMQEHLFAGNVVITGNWLPYETFIERGIYLKRIDKIDEVGSTLLCCIKALSLEKEKCRKNADIIYQLSSWENNINTWLSLYN